jgi:hypothetical protein
MNTVITKLVKDEHKSSWLIIYEWILRSDVLKKFIKDNLADKYINHLYEKFQKNEEKEMQKEEKEMQKEEKKKRYSERRSSELSYTTHDIVSKEQFVRHLFINIAKYKDTQDRLLYLMHTIRDTNGNTILHIMAKINASDEQAFMVIDRYYGKNLWLEPNHNNELPLHLLMRHRQIAHNVFLYAYNKSIDGLHIQTKDKGNTPLHEFFKKQSDISLQSYIMHIDFQNTEKTKQYEKYFEIPNNKGETSFSLYNKNKDWYLRDQLLRRGYNKDFAFTTLPAQSDKSPSIEFIKKEPKIKESVNTSGSDFASLLEEAAKRSHERTKKSSSSSSSEKQKSKRTKLSKK